MFIPPSVFREMRVLAAILCDVGLFLNREKKGALHARCKDTVHYAHVRVKVAAPAEASLS